MRVRLAAYGVVVVDGRILLAHWNEHGRSGWTLPGGGVEPGEDPIEGAVREIWEETGFHASIDVLLGIDSAVIKASDRIVPTREPMQAVRIVYEASIIGGELRSEADGSTDEARWFTFDEVADLHRVSLVDTALRLREQRPENGHLRPQARAVRRSH
ncbi:NUDIX domain-containing protein [Pseudoclavibacter chungangensis]|uniref:NUDIX domain-containing protein n=1 Tax=Pseudoclavibacter chungangensis TaxID=587635 RepID=A0A7J5BPW0_9MICO|nr:NUDIX domain-containing protein [Pseudoclavibacter chungangensis]KAB1655349.1 NUDIX domain-containing protein [Pseudoclavibacter chungangensis]NYJ68299.1 8-oxo-dGTP diphosphatase [Pseudoclavibacter chungangensis]